VTGLDGKRGKKKRATGRRKGDGAKSESEMVSRDQSETSGTSCRSASHLKMKRVCRSPPHFFRLPP
jgi:hypothetical protein